MSKREFPTSWWFWGIYLIAILGGGALLQVWFKAKAIERDMACETLPYKVNDRPVCVIWRAK